MKAGLLDNDFLNESLSRLEDTWSQIGSKQISPLVRQKSIRKESVPMQYRDGKDITCLPIVLSPQYWNDFQEWIGVCFFNDNLLIAMKLVLIEDAGMCNSNLFNLCGNNICQHNERTEIRAMKQKYYLAWTILYRTSGINRTRLIQLHT